MILNKQLFGLVGVLIIFASGINLAARHGHGHGGDVALGVGAGVLSGIVVGSLISHSNKAPDTSALRSDILTLDRNASATASDVSVLNERLNGLTRRADELRSRIAALESLMAKK